MEESGIFDDCSRAPGIAGCVARKMPAVSGARALGRCAHEDREAIQRRGTRFQSGDEVPGLPQNEE